MVLPADDMGDAQGGVVGAGSEMVGRHAVGAKQREILDVVGGLQLVAVNRIAESHNPAVAGRAKTQGEGLACGGTAITLGRRKIAGVSIEEPGSLGAGFFGIPGMRG